jgi:hypothetical protein
LRQKAELGRPAIVVVASGGGTRAALYTASVLKGLHSLGVDRDIVLASGVSGGGVALAYFSANRDALTGPIPPDKEGKCHEEANVTRDEWACFTKRVTKPFIEDVLNGATEWRLFRTTPLSSLLAESFTRDLLPKQSTLGSLKNTQALILNSTLVGHLAEQSDALERTIDDETQSCEEAERPFKLMSGGRLIFTNLQDQGTDDKFPTRWSPIPDVRLPYKIVKDSNVPLAAAAALNANFPPVFPNARIRIQSDGQRPCEHRSYYVTDGGAEENLGLISALYALESALAKIPSCENVRPIHVVIAEASAVAYDYREDWGTSVVLGESSERLTGGLTNELIERLQCKDGSKATVQFNYLGLPLAFRARGGFPTHWMYPTEFHLNDPRPRTTSFLVEPSERKAILKRTDLEELWSALHDPDKSFCDYGFESHDAEKVKKWVCGPQQDDRNGRDLHMEKWKKLVCALRPNRKLCP